MLAQQSAKRKAVGPSAPAPAGARAAAGGVLSEDEQLQMAIAMSMGQGQQGEHMMQAGTKAVQQASWVAIYKMYVAGMILASG